jgi:hypothetical protein
MYVLQGYIKSGGYWWTVRNLRTINQLVAAHKRFKDRPNWRIVWDNDPAPYK